MSMSNDRTSRTSRAASSVDGHRRQHGLVVHAGIGAIVDRDRSEHLLAGHPEL
jgi:hypothetical protein